MALWPREQDLPYRSWLQNFDEDHRTVAAEVLNHLIFISEDMAHDALSCAYQRLLRAYTGLATHDQIVPADSLRAFHESIIVAPVRGEDPSAADSGIGYMRTARDQLGFKESQIKTDPVEAARLASQSGRLVVLIDDISGSGEQVEATLTQRPKNAPSLATICSQPSKVACLTTIMTSHAHRMLTRTFPHLGVFAGHLLDLASYGARAIFPEEDRPETHQLLRWAAQELEVPPHVHELYGYKELGLLLCFHNSVPDFSLPILWARGRRDGWTPLKDRRGG